MPDLTNFNRFCIVCKGSGEIQADETPLPCPACLAEHKVNILLAGIQSIAQYGLNHPNQPFIRAFHAETITIAKVTLDKFYNRQGSDMFLNLAERSNHAE